MAELARSGASEGLWLRAERQRAGKGRQGRAWQSPPGNLYVSTLVRTHPIGTALTARLADGTSMDGLFGGLDGEGALILRLADGTSHVIHAADVFLL